ncbi:hypothetical protein TGAM01_v208373, partial [Trichoderma gamsii]
LFPSSLSSPILPSLKFGQTPVLASDISELYKLWRAAADAGGGLHYAALPSNSTALRRLTLLQIVWSCRIRSVPCNVVIRRREPQWFAWRSTRRWSTAATCISISTCATIQRLT